MIYNKEFLTSELQRFEQENNNNLTLNDIQGKLEYPSYILYDIYFGSFDIAINMIKSKSNNELIEKKYLIFELQRFKKENNRNPEIIDFYKIFGCSGFNNFLKYFDCISDVLTDIGVRIDMEYTRKRLLLQQLRVFADAYKRNPCINDVVNSFYFTEYRIDARSYASSFGSFHNALMYAGLTIDLEYQKILDVQFLISELQRFKLENSRNPRQIDMFKKNGYPPMNHYLKHFGTWNNALAEAELEMNEKLTDEEFLISELHRFVLDNSRNPKMIDMQIKFGYPSSGAYTSQFGSWNNALIKAGLKINNIIYSKEFLISELQRFKLENRRNPKMIDIQIKFGYPAAGAYQSQFGTWNNALIEAGLKINEDLIDKEFLISELQRFKNENGRSPKSSDMQGKFGYPNYNVYQKYFGSWFNAIVEAEINERQKLK